MERKGTSRRGFLKAAAIAGASLGVPGGVRAEGNAPEDGEGAAPSVPRRVLGKTGEKVPILALGCAQTFDPVYDKLLHRAFHDGVNYLDTARVYADGASHRTIKPFLKQIGDRKKIWITSKEAMERPEVEGYRKGLDACLEELGTEYLDLFFMHSLKDTRALAPEFLKLGDALRKSGKTRFFGFSSHGERVVDLLEKAASSGGIDAIMFSYNFGKYGDLALNKAIDKCVAAGIGLIAMKTQKSVPKDQEEVLAFESASFTLAQAKLKAVWADERISTICSHMENTTQLAENVAASRSPKPLSMAEFQSLQRIATKTAAYSCQGCAQHCEPHLPAGVKIADPLRFLMYFESYGEQAKARALYRRLDESCRASDGVDWSAASAACPQGIDIAARMRRVREQLA